MLNPKPFAALLNAFDAAPVSVQAASCLNVRHKDAGCRLCAESCPADAIALSDSPRLDPERCVNCGLCLHRCSVDVFAQESAPEDRLVQTVTSLPEDAVVLVCPQHAEPTRTRAPASVVVRHRRCLAALSPTWLLALAGDGQRTLWLDDCPCAACPIGRAHPAIVQSATVANRLLQAFGRPSLVHIVAGNPDALREEMEPRHLVDGDRPQVSRRGLFSALSRLTQRTAVAMVEESLPTPVAAGPLPVDQRLPQRVPASRARLYRQLKRLETPASDPIATDGLPFAQVVVEEKTCSACGWCARFCPTGALSLTTHGGRFILAFQPMACIDCGLCAVACPEHAVSFGSELSPEALLGSRPVLLADGDLTACVDCGQPIAVQIAAPARCFICRRRADTATLFAGLTGADEILQA